MDLTWLALFVVGFFTDVIWVMWMTSVEKLRPWWSGFWGMMTSVIGVLAIVDIVSNHFNAIPYFVGIFFGSVVSVFHKRRQNTETDMQKTKS